MQETDLIGFCEDLHRHRAMLESSMAEITRLVTGLRGYKAAVFDPAKGDVQIGIEPDTGDLARFQAALNDLADFSEIDNLQGALQRFFALGIFNTDIYTIRPSVEVQKVIRGRQERAEAAARAEAARVAAGR